MIRLRPVEDLAKELKRDKKQTLAHLNALGVKVVDGFFDTVRFEAAVGEPQWLRNKRNEWSLSPRTGLGAVKHLLDPLGVIIIEHECRGSQYLMLRSGGPSITGRSGSAGKGLGSKKSFCKMYYKGTFISQRTNKTVSFDINNFKKDDAPDYYVCMCFEGPLMWVFSKDALLEAHASLRRSGYGKYVDEMTISQSQLEREFGGIHALVNDKSSSLLVDAKQLGL